MTKELNFIPLNSVGSVIEVNSMMIYPQMEDGNPDMGMGTYYTEVSSEWLDACPDSVKTFILSIPKESEDREEIVNKLVNNLIKISTK